VIALRASGVSDVVQDQRNGRVLRANAAKETFADAIRDAFAGEKLAEWNREARQTAERFSRRNCAARLLELYETMVGKETRPQREAEMLDTIYTNIKIEWELVQEKMSALLDTLTETGKNRPLSRRSECT